MSLILAGLLFAGTGGALFLGRWFARRREGAAGGEPRNENDEDEARGREEADNAAPRRSDDADPDDPRPRQKAEPPGGTTRKPLPPAKGDKVRLEGFVCQLGDVVMRLTGEEAWLAGGVVLSEEIPVAVLFVAPDAGHDSVIYVRAPPHDSLVWLDPLDPSAILVGGEPPSSVEHGGIRFDRTRRLPLRPRRIGVGAPDFGDAVVVAEYASAGAQRLLVLKANTGVVRAYRGVELERGAFEVIASGSSTLEE